MARHGGPLLRPDCVEGRLKASEGKHYGRRGTRSETVSKSPDELRARRGRPRV